MSEIFEFSCSDILDVLNTTKHTTCARAFANALMLYISIVFFT